MSRNRVSVRLPSRREEAGASSVELIVFFPLLLAIILLAVQASLVWYGNEVAMTTARETARVLRTSSDAPADKAAAIDWARQYAADTANGGLTDVAVEVEVGADSVEVTVSGKAMDVFGGLTPRVSATVTGPVERFEGDK